MNQLIASSFHACGENDAPSQGDQPLAHIRYLARPCHRFFGARNANIEWTLTKTAKDRSERFVKVPGFAAPFPFESNTDTEYGTEGSQLT